MIYLTLPGLCGIMFKSPDSLSLDISLLKNWILIRAKERKQGYNYRWSDGFSMGYTLDECCWAWCRLNIVNRVIKSKLSINIIKFLKQATLAQSHVESANLLSQLSNSKQEVHAATPCRWVTHILLYCVVFLQCLFSAHIWLETTACYLLANIMS